MDRAKAARTEIKKSNRNKIFRYMCKCGKVSNPDISYALKLSLPTVMQNTKELIERGLLMEVGELESTGGRRAKALSVVSDARLAVGLDITKNHIGLLLTNLVGEIIKYDRISLVYVHSEAYYHEVHEKLEKFLDESMAERGNILGIGISFPGIVDLDKEAVTYSHVLGVRQLPFEQVSRFFEYPCYFLNDANAGAYAEGIRMEVPERFFYLSLSNTVGGAIFNRRELIQGNHFRCGEVGHMTVVPDGEVCYCGKKGCLDVYCSANRLAELTGGKLERFFEALSLGDLEAVNVWDKYTDYLAMAINNIHMVLDCDIILGGYVGCYAEPYIQDIWKKVSGRNTFAEDRVFVRTCRYRTETAALGAALKIMETFVEEI